MFGEIKELFSKIPSNAKICIWGRANAGISIKEELERYRKDTKFVAFIDSYNCEGGVDSKVYKPEDIAKIRGEFDFMIVSTRSDCTIIDALLFYYDINFVRISPYLLKKYQFIPSKVEKILSFLEEQEDKKLYLDLIEARINKNTNKLKKYVLKKHNIKSDRKRTIKQYTSFINYSAIETVIEGGMFNGLNTIIFKKLFKNLKKIYAFELIYEKVKNKTISHIIDSMDELEIVPYALWDKKDELVFSENTKMPYSSGINPQFNKKNADNKFKVSAISIDEFKRKNNIKKIDFIKMDIEGAELNALMGAKNTLVEDRAQLAISIYHSDNDIQDIPLYLYSILKNYVFRIGQYSPDNDETILYAIPKELYKKGN